jgi:hypothetical protein
MLTIPTKLMWMASFFELTSFSSHVFLSSTLMSTSATNDTQSCGDKDPQETIMGTMFLKLRCRGITCYEYEGSIKALQMLGAVLKVCVFVLRSRGTHFALLPLF